MGCIRRQGSLSPTRRGERSAHRTTDKTTLSFWTLSGTILHLHLVWQHFKEAPCRPYTDDTVFPNGLQLFALVNPIISEPRIQKQMKDFLMLPILDSNQTERY